MTSNYALYSRSKILGVGLIWWLSWTVIHTFVLHRLAIGWEIAGMDAVISNVLLAIASFVIIVIYRFYQPGKTNRVYRFIIGIMISGIFCMVLQWALALVFHENKEYLDFLERSIPVRFVFSLLIISFITLSNWLWNSVQEQKENEKRKADTEQLIREAELNKLRQQLQPHFLFNSLNSISALVGTKPNEARKMIQQLSDFLRGTLKKDDQQLVKLSEELDHLRLYLDIEKVRFGHRLTIEINTGEETANYKLPSLLLQPIVENAIKFGLYDVTGNVTITITTQLQDAYLYIEVKNPFDSETQGAKKGVGFGLTSVQRRLYLLYARNDLLLTEKKGTVFITTLKIPELPIY
jgi:two-component system, LytTR family, sensor kinase